MSRTKQWQVFDPVSQDKKTRNSGFGRHHSFSKSLTQTCVLNMLLAESEEKKRGAFHIPMIMQALCRHLKSMNCVWFVCDLCFEPYSSLFFFQISSCSIPHSLFVHINFNPTVLCPQASFFTLKESKATNLCILFV